MYFVIMSLFLKMHTRNRRFIPIEILLFCEGLLLLLFIIPFYSSAETVKDFSLCSSGICIENPTDLAVSNNGDFLLILDSSEQPSLAKSNVLSDTLGSFVFIPLGDDISDSSFLNIEISKDNKKALVISSSIAQAVISNQIFAEGTACNCPLGYYFDETVCIFGMITCDSTQDTVCGCDNKNYLNSCISRSNGIKKYTKATCGTTSDLTCSSDLDCPLGSCPKGGTFKKFACTNSMCMLIEFSKEPCNVPLSSSSSGSSMTVEDSCNCKTGNYFDGSICTVGSLNCQGDSDTVCGCDNNNYLNSCVVHANGIKKFTRGVCGTSSNLSCTNDSQCPAGKCPSGGAFNQYSCTNSMCTLIQYFVDPCLLSSSGGSNAGGHFSTIKIINLIDKSVKTFTPDINGKGQVISAAAFSDPEGKELLLGNNDSAMTIFFTLDTESGEVKDSFSGPGVSKSIEFSPDYNKGLITFTGTQSKSVGFYNKGTKTIKKLDIPNQILFDIDEFLSGADFDLKSERAVLSSLGGKHVTHIIDLKNQRITINFYGNNLEGATRSTISPDGLFTVSAGEISEGNEIAVYKLNISKIRKPRLLKALLMKNEGSIFDIAITPDNNRVLLLLVKQEEKRIKVLSLKDLSTICDYKVSNGTSADSLTVDPLGRYLAFINNDSINIVNDIRLAPVLKSISTNKNKFTIDGFVDPERFNKDINVCLQGKKMCAKSVTVSDDGKTITGDLQRISNKGRSITITGEEKQTSEELIQCGSETKSFYSMILE